MKTILITGSKGQLGSELQILRLQFPQFAFHFHDVDTLDITDIQSLRKCFKEISPNYIINCAAYTAVDKAESEIEKAYLINETAVANIEKIAREFKTKIIHTSTDYVFDGNANVPYVETDKTNPVSVYGKSKLKGEEKLFNNSNAIIIRTSWLYSSFGNNFVKTMLRVGKEKGELKVVCDQVGTPTYAADLALAILQIISKIEDNIIKFIPGIYHFSNEGACSWYDFACEIIQQANINCIVKPVETSEYPTPTKRPAYSVLNKKKIKNNFSIDIPWWKDGLTRCLPNLL
jgi:dTDP-4-dehydrorhamnose reductase